jgi:hypothetical protein
MVRCRCHSPIFKKKEKRCLVAAFLDQTVGLVRHLLQNTQTNDNRTLSFGEI